MKKIIQLFFVSLFFVSCAEKQQTQKVTYNQVLANQLEEMYALSNSYEDLFNKRAKLYNSMDLKNQALTEKDYKQFIQDEYTFLKRPVFILNDEIFIGNSKKVIEALKVKIG